MALRRLALIFSFSLSALIASHLRTFVVRVLATSVITIRIIAETKFSVIVKLSLKKGKVTHS